MPGSQLPPILTVSHIKDYLKISYNEAKEIFELCSHIVISIGASQRILKGDFLKWIESNPKIKH